MSYIIADHLSIGYEGREIAKDISFRVKKGDYLYVIGENGAGKSTLMKTILGLINPIKGKIVFEDGLGKKEIGYLPQQTQIQKNFPASVEEIVLSGCQGHKGLRPFYTREEKRIAKENMELLHLSEIRKSCYRELSGGQQQRVMLARAICATRKVLLLDEPVAGLDPKVTEELYSLIGLLNHENGVTIIMISHDMKAAMTYASHILYIGKSIFYGTREEYMEIAGNKKLIADGGI